MSFRRTTNTHDRWLGYCKRMESAVTATGLPPELFCRVEPFEEFLERGVGGGDGERQTVLSRIPDAAFLALEQIVNGYFDFHDGYPAFQEERFRRFQRYG